MKQVKILQKKKLDEFYYAEDMNNHLPSQKWIIECISKRKDLYDGIIEERKHLFQQDIESAANYAIDYFKEKGNKKKKWADVHERFRNRITYISMNCARIKLLELISSEDKDLKVHEPKKEWIKQKINEKKYLYVDITEDRTAKLQVDIEMAVNNAINDYRKVGKEKLSSAFNNWFGICWPS